MVQAKSPLVKKQKRQKRGVDFKKIKRKIGRKLPPPQNATNTEVKFKAIVLPEQSVAAEKTGLAVNKKGLTLKELLQQTSHYNQKVRRDALIGIKDLFAKYPEELKLHRYAVVEKLRERMSDEDRLVRETLYQLFKTVIFPNCKEDSQGPLIPLMMAYIFNAMTHLSIDIRLMALKFIDLVVENHSPSFLLYSDKILQNYETVLRKDQFYLQENNKLKMVLAGLVHCLSLLPYKKTEVGALHEKDTDGKSALHAFESDEPSNSAGFSVIVVNLKNLMPVLVGCFREFVPLVQQQLDTPSFNCMLYILQSIDFAVRFFLYGNDICQAEFEVSPSHEDGAMWAEALSPLLYGKLWDVFPLKENHHFAEKDSGQCAILNLVITKIFLQFCKRIHPPVNLLERFIQFIESALSGEVFSILSGKGHYEKYILSLFPFLPKLMLGMEGYWKCSILQAFTKTFQNCKPGSSLKLACLSAVEEILLPMDGMLLLDLGDSNTLSYIISWIRELPKLLLRFGDSHSSWTKAVLQLQLRLGQCAVMHSSLAQEYDNMQYSLLQFYSDFSNEKTPCYGPFIRLSRDSQELSVCCLYYFYHLDESFLKSIASCVLCHDVEPFILFRIIEVLHSSYKAGHIRIEDHISFFITVLTHFEVFPEKHLPVSSDGKTSNHGIFRSITGVICSCLFQMGDDSLIYDIIEKSIFDQISQRPPLDNMCALLRILVMLDSGRTKLLEQSILKLANLLPGYLMDVAYCVPEVEDGSTLSISICARRYYLIPCFFLFQRSCRLLNLVLDMMGSLVCGTAADPSCVYEQYASDHSSRIIAIASILLWMLKDMKLQRVLVSFEAEIDQILRNILQVQTSEQKDLTLEARHKIKCAYDRLKVVISTLPIGCREAGRSQPS